MRRFPVKLVPVLCIALSACSAPEALEETITPEARATAPAEIAPLEGLLTGPETRLTAEDADELLARGRSAQAKASALR